MYLCPAVTSRANSPYIWEPRRRRSPRAERQRPFGFEYLAGRDLLGLAGLALEVALLGLVELVAGHLELLDQHAQVVAQPRGLAAEVLAFEDAPLPQHRQDDLVEMDARIVDAADRDDHRLAPKLRHREPGHLEVPQDAVHRPHRLIGRDVQARGAD